MNLLYLGLGLVVVAYIGYNLQRSWRMLRRCSAATSAGNIIEVDGNVVGLIDEQIKTLFGKTISTSYPRYEGALGDKKVLYTSVVRRSDVAVGDSAILCCEEGAGFAWAKGDMELLRRQIRMQFLVMIALLILLTLASIFI